MQKEPQNQKSGKFLNFLAYSSADAVAICSVFYFFATVTQTESAKMPASRFFLILLFGFLAEGAHLLLVPGVKGVPKWLSRLMHFSVLLAAFLILTLAAGLLSGSAKIFVAVVLFTALYAAIALLCRFLHKIIR